MLQKETELVSRLLRFRTLVGIHTAEESARLWLLDHQSAKQYQAQCSNRHLPRSPEDTQAHSG